MTDYRVMLTTCNSRETAEAIAFQLLEKRLVACVNILPQGLSMYRWQGQIETEEEFLLIMKSHRNHYVAIENTLRQIHPYEVPELLVLSVENGLPAYLSWLASELNIS